MKSGVVSVGMVTSYIRDLLDGDDVLSDAWIEGEVSNLFRAQSGHCYFVLKDAESQLKCVLFRHSIQRQRYGPRDGEHVSVHGRIGVYEREGAFQLYVDLVQPAGIGIAALQLARLRQQLEAEGLFDPARKRPLPVAPRTIAVVTSGDGAVWHDIQTVISRRYPLVHLLLAPTAVQGDAAPLSIVAALEAVGHDGRADLVIVARGGGSAEDLGAFNDERVARAVYACPIPVVSAIGHETDHSIVDDVADVRVPTPSAAAELCVPDVREIGERLAEYRLRLGRVVTDDVASARRSSTILTRQLAHRHPAERIARHRRDLSGLRRISGSSHRQILNQTRSAVAERRVLLAALDPMAVLGRGFAFVTHGETGAAVTGIGALAGGDPIVVRLLDGVLGARVESATTIGSPGPVGGRR